MDSINGDYPGKRPKRSLRIGGRCPGFVIAHLITKAILKSRIFQNRGKPNWSKNIPYANSRSHIKIPATYSKIDVNV